MTMTTGMTVDASIPRRQIRSLEFALSSGMLSSFLRSSGQSYLQERADKRFAAGGDSATGKWAPLATKTLDLWGQHEPNVLTGELENFITRTPGQITPLMAGAKLELPGQGGPSRKLKVAQKGLKPNPIKGWRDIPARPVVALDATDATVMTGMLLTWLEIQIRSGKVTP